MKVHALAIPTNVWDITTNSESKTKKHKILQCNGGSYCLSVPIALTAVKTRLYTKKHKSGTQATEMKCLGAVEGQDVRNKVVRVELDVRESRVDCKKS